MAHPGAHGLSHHRRAPKLLANSRAEEILLSQTKPPFRAEHIGSLLRPKSLLSSARFARGEIDQSALTEAEDKAIRDALKLQEQLGFKFATDGEFRRRSYHSFFYRQLGDVSIDTVAGADAPGAKGGGGRGSQPVALIGGRVRWTHPINAADVTFLKTNSKLLPKITIPGPCALHFRGGDAAVTAVAYKDVDLFWSDIVEAFTKELRALADAGCRYVQIDETAFAKFGDPDVQASLAARGDDWSELIDRYVDVTNRVLRAAPAGHAHRHASLPRQSRRPLACRRQLRGGRRTAVQRARDTVLFPRVRHRPRRHLHAASLRAEAQVGRARPRLDEDAGPRGQVRFAASLRRCDQVRGHGAAGDQPAMRLCQRGHRQSGFAGGTEAEA